MRERHCSQDFQKQLQLAAHIPALSGLDQRQTIDKLHHQVRCAVQRLATVQEPGNIGMLQTRQDPAFLAETAPCCFAIDLPFDDLDGYALLEAPSSRTASCPPWPRRRSRR